MWVGSWSRGKCRVKTYSVTAEESYVSLRVNAPKAGNPNKKKVNINVKKGSRIKLNTG